MEYTTLGNSPDPVSRLGLGCWAIGGHGYGRTDDAESERVVQVALELGIDLFDTADVYGFGHSESLLGRALGSRRHDVRIATKVGVAWNAAGTTWRDSSPERIRTAVDQSLRRLGVECIWLYQLHWHDGVAPIEAAIEALAQCRAAGKVHYIGCCNLGPAEIGRAITVHPVTTAQFRYSVLHAEAEDQLRECTHDLGVGTIAYGVLGRGMLSGTLDVGTVFDERDTRRDDDDFAGDRFSRGLRLVERLRAVGRRHERTPAQTAIRWALDNENVSCVLIGSKTVEQLRENAGALGWRVDPAERALLAQDGNRTLAS